MIGKNLRHYMSKYDIKIADLAKKTGLKAEYIQAVLDRYLYPTQKDITQLARGLEHGITPADLGAPVRKDDERWLDLSSHPVPEYLYDFPLLVKCRDNKKTTVFTILLLRYSAKKGWYNIASHVFPTGENDKYPITFNKANITEWMEEP